MATPASAAPPTAPDEIPTILATSRLNPDARISVYVVGAGGTGARVVPPLLQMLRRDDTVSIIDHDVVEDRNLLRQHFAPADIGNYKAQVLADRYRQRDISVNAFATQLTEANAVQLLRAGLPTGPRTTTGSALVLLGCVDNPAARKSLTAALAGAASIAPAAWIDAGNEMRGGQVLVSLANWPLNVRDRDRGHQTAFDLPGLVTAMPQLLRRQPWHCRTCDIDCAADATSCTTCKQPQESCADRIDTQTVQVNHMAAAAIINAFNFLRMGIPFTSAGAFFSTLNTMQPIRLASVRTQLSGRPQLLPETTYALTA